ncbi:Armadillo [Artemisia annua]|uniref:Armadillo n=1 Tax=Artemisia annua TaxID=35608 RepID=A0A2U1KIV6_ARTAN|nr:Armadillo [Artemisia annua]
MKEAMPIKKKRFRNGYNTEMVVNQEEKRRQSQEKERKEKELLHIVNQQVLPRLRELLSNNHEEEIRKGACRTISIMIASNKEELIQKVIDAHIIEPLVELLQNPELDTLEEAAWAISNAIYYGSHTQIKHLVSCGCVKQLCHLHTCQEPKIVTLCLEGLENILMVSDQKDSAGSDVNPYVQMIEAKCFEQIKKLQTHDDANIQKIATVLVKTWVEKQDDGNATCEVDQPGFGGANSVVCFIQILYRIICPKQLLTPGFGSQVLY